MTVQDLSRTQVNFSIYRSCYLERVYTIAELNNFSKLTRKHLCLSFLIKFQALTLIKRDSSSRTPMKRKAATGSVLWKKLVLKISQYSQGKTPELESLLKLDSHLPKKFCFICFTESPLKMMKNAFYFILKALLVLKVFKFLSWLFAHVEKTAWLER